MNRDIREFKDFLSEQISLSELTTQQIADQSGITQRQLYRYRNGEQSPSIENAANLLETLGHKIFID